MIQFLSCKVFLVAIHEDETDRTRPTFRVSSLPVLRIKMVDRVDPRKISQRQNEDSRVYLRLEFILFRCIKNHFTVLYAFISISLSDEKLSTKNILVNKKQTVITVPLK